MLHVANVVAVVTAFLRKELADLSACDCEVNTGLAMEFSGF